MEKKISLEKIYTELVEINDSDGLITVSKDSIMNFAKEACSQALELAAENVEIQTNESDINNIEFWVDKQSIIDTIKQIEP